MKTYPFYIEVSRDKAVEIQLDIRCREMPILHQKRIAVKLAQQHNISLEWRD